MEFWSGKNTGVDCHSLLRGSSQLREWTWVSWITGRFFTIWATREAPWYTTKLPVGWMVVPLWHLHLQWCETDHQEVRLSSLSPISQTYVYEVLEPHSSSPQWIEWQVLIICILLFFLLQNIPNIKKGRSEHNEYPCTVSQIYWMIIFCTYFF